MRVLTTGPSTERLVRTALLALLIVGFAVAYMWDGHRGYARKNAQELLKLLGLTGQALPAIDPAMSAERGRQLAGELKPGEPAAAVTAKLGAPALQHGADSYYVGPGGWLKISVAEGRVIAAAWTDGSRTEADQKWQRWIGWSLTIGGLLAVFQLVRVARTRLTLRFDGLCVGRRLRIPLDCITEVRDDPPGKAGCTDVCYRTPFAAGVVRLDPYIYKNIAPIVAEIRLRQSLGGPEYSERAEGA